MPRPLDGYPTPIGSSVLSVNGIAGPSSYTQITAGTPPAVATGGQIIYPVEFGLKYFDYVSAGLDDSGVNRIECIPGARSGLGPSGAASYYTLRWVVVATGSQVAGTVNLSGAIVRVMAIGPK